MSYLYYDNVQFLLQLNKEKNNQRKVDFFRETNISRQSLHNWKQGSVPASTTLNRVIGYFNKWLRLELTPALLLNTDLTAGGPPSGGVAEAPPPYIIDKERQLLIKFRKLHGNDQQLIMQLIDRLIMRGI